MHVLGGLSDPSETSYDGHYTWDGYNWISLSELPINIGTGGSCLDDFRDKLFIFDGS